MGNTFSGSTKVKGYANYGTKQQQQGLNRLLEGSVEPGAQLMAQQLQPYNFGDYEDVFNKAYVDPAMNVYNQQIVPGIQQRFSNLGAGSSSALNQALAQSATDLGTMLGSQFGGFYNEQANRQQNYMNMYQNALLGKAGEPIIHNKPDQTGDFIKLAAAILPLAFSDKKTKENVKDYAHGLDYLDKWQVKQYDYKQEFGGLKDRVGMMAQDLPEEIVIDDDGLKCVDTYGLLCVAINAIKQLSEKVEKLEEKNADRS